MDREKEAMLSVEGLREFINNCVSPFHTVDTVKKMLLKHQFTELSISEDFTLAAGGKYFVSIYDSSLMAFTVGSQWKTTFAEGAAIRCVSSHTDFPCFKIKPDCIIYAENKSGMGYLKINTEVYGGPILNTWLDRPLSVAGRMIVKGAGAFEVKSILVDAKRPVFIIPNLAIHMNREVNKGVELNPQKDMLPVTALVESGKWQENKTKRENRYEDVITLLFEDEMKRRNMKREDILDYELYLYNYEEGCIVGVDAQMYSSPRLDNLVSVYAQTVAMTEAERTDGINAAFYFDNEEIGSRTKQGAASSVAALLMEKMYRGLKRGRNEMVNDMLTGFMLSVDVAHALHPNSPEKSDITNHVMPNRGIVLKIAASQSYSNDAVGSSVVRALCGEHGIPCQSFVNKSDMAGGQTLGAISSTVLPMRTVDIGIPLLAMHSARELMGVHDEKNLEKFLTVYYS